jgi:DNA-binding GntR family transcriptional regulator
MMHTVSKQGTPGTPGDPINRGSTDTPSEQVTAIVRARIKSGQYPPGSRLPSNNTLSQELGVATRTVRKGLAPLVDEGLIVTKAGWGTFVRS